MAEGWVSRPRRIRKFCCPARATKGRRKSMLSNWLLLGFDWQNVLGSYHRSFPTSSIHCLWCWWFTSPFPPLQTQPLYNSYIGGIWWSWCSDSTDNFHRRCLIANFYGSFDEVCASLNGKFGVKLTRDRLAVSGTNWGVWEKCALEIWCGFLGDYLAQRGSCVNIGRIADT